jgi:hypothetical protein
VKTAETNPDRAEGSHPPRPKTAGTNPGSNHAQDSRPPKRRERTQEWALWVSSADHSRSAESTRSAKKKCANEANVTLAKPGKKGLW